VSASEHGEHLGPQRRIVGQLAPHLHGAGVEDVAHGRFTVTRGVRVGTRQQAGDELGDARGLCRLDACTVALGRQPRRVVADEAQHDDDHRRRRRDSAGMPARERGQSIGQRVGTRRDRLPAQVPAHVVGKRAHRRVALAR
jgi:hypothetical protein